MALGVLEALQKDGKVRPLAEVEHNSAEYLHAVIEVLRIAFADTLHYVADPDVVHVPVKEMLSKVSDSGYGSEVVWYSVLCVFPFDAD